MLNISVKDCKDCGAISEVSRELDCKIASLSLKEYNHIVYLAPSERPKLLKRLMYYRGILNNLYFNSSYYCFDYKIILSRIKSLIN